jgi:nucleotide-binding universal stress UspA family protein
MAPRVVGAGSRMMYQRILVPVDGSGCADRGLSEAIALARLTGGRLRLVHVIDEPFLALGSDGAIGASADLITLAREAAQRVLADASTKVRLAGIAVDSVLLDTFDGRLCDLVVGEAKAASSDLVVIGTHGRRGVDRFLLGSDAEQILRLSPVPVLLVRHE